MTPCTQKPGIFNFAPAWLSPLKQLASCGLLIHISCSVASAATPDVYQYSSKPWPIRYFLYVTEEYHMKIVNHQVTEMNRRIDQGIDDSVYKNFEEYFPPIRIIRTKESKLAVVLMNFNRSGTLLSPAISELNFTAAKTGIGSLVLIKNGTGDESHKPYRFARWWDFPGHHLMFPAVCDSTAEYRYETNDPKRKEYVGGFGCREWSAQMRDDQRPYIDVTSYYRKDYHVIGKFVGWSGFDNKPKPVIGKHNKAWICLHECPNGEEPGIIPNIRVWTKKHGFPMPMRPARQPEYPNAMFPDIYAE